jgi:hypothetical protein
MSDSTEESAQFFDIEPDSTIFVTVFSHAEDDARLGVITTDSKPILPEGGDLIKLGKMNLENETDPLQDSGSYRVVDRRFKYTSIRPNGDEDENEEENAENDSESHLLGTGVTISVEPIEE